MAAPNANVSKAALKAAKFVLKPINNNIPRAVSTSVLVVAIV